MPSITLPQDVHTRPATPEDAQAICAMQVEHELAAMGISESTPADVLEQWKEEGTDLTRDTLVVTTPEDEIVGFTGVAATQRGVMLDAHTGVRLAYKDQSIVSSLLHFAEERAHALLAAHAETRRLLYAWSFTPDFTHVLEQHGFTVEASDFRMRIVLDTPPPSPRSLEGITIRPFVRGQEERAVYDVIAEAFPDIDGEPYRPYEDWYEGVFVKSSSFEPAMLSVAEADGQVVGTILCRFWPDAADGHIWQVAVRRAWRKRGIALNLLYTAFGEYYRRGIRQVILDVDVTNQTGAQELYLRAGMYVRSQTDYMTRTLE
ncbi:MAG: GNAT family N-acetyltransferase [Ktedonobacteraceae bacterium]